MNEPCNSQFTERPACRAALILNNLGVRLLERHCYNQALLTLRDALALLRFGIDSAEGMAHKAKESVVVHVQECVKLATSRLATPESHKAAMPLRMLDTESLSATSYQLLSSALSPNERIIIRMEASDLEHSPVDSAVLESSILMHNFAVTYQCMSRSLCSDTNRMGLLQGAKDLQMASSKLLRNYRDDCTDCIRLSSLLHLEVIVLTDFVSLLFELCEDEQAKDSHEELRDLVEWVDAGMLFWKSMQPTPNTAGAA